MQNLILYIQPQLTSTTVTQDFVRVDLMEEDLITLTQVIQDIKDVDKLFTDYSKTFNLPASKTNNKIFKYWFNPDVIGFDANVFCEARIELNHFHYRFGTIQLNEVVMKNGSPSMFKVTFYGKTTNFKDKINEDQLSDLVWLNNFNHDADATYIKDALQNGKDIVVDSVTYTNAIIYPLIAHSQSYIFDATNNLDNGLNVSTAATNKDQRGVLPVDLKPAIPIKNILKAIEEQYSITFKTGEFFDSAAMNNLYLWLHRDKGSITGDLLATLNNITFNCNGPNCSHYNGISYPSVQFSLGAYIFTQAFTNSVEEGFKFTVNINPASNTIPYSIEIVNSLTDTVVATASNLTGSQSHSIGYGRFQTNSLSLNESRRLYARIRSESALTFSASVVCFHSFQEDDGFYDFELNATFATTSSSIVTSASIIITEQIPELKINDFLNGLFRAFNLTGFVDFNGQIVIKTLDSFYAGGQTQDITEYVKTDTHTIGEALPFSNVDFEYPDPKSILAQRFQFLNNRKFGSLSYIGDATKKSNYKIKLPFGHVLYERLQDKTSKALTTIQVGSFLNDNLEPSIGSPLLFYGIQQTSGTTALNFLESTRPTTYAALCPSGNDTSISSYWIPSNSNELGTSTTAPTYNLNFGSEINSYTLTDYGGNNNSLFQLYYNNYITRVFNKKTRIFNFTAILPLKVLLNLTLDDLIVIGTRAYTINMMTIKLQSGETNLELLNEPI